MELARQLRELKRSKDVLEALGMRWFQPRRSSLERALSCKLAGKIADFRKEGMIGCVRCC